MKHTLITCILFLTFSGAVSALSAVRDSLAAEAVYREFTLSPIRIEGEVENPAVVELGTLPIRSVPVKELGLDESGKLQFKGAFFYTGYSLYDILKTVKVKKANNKDFKPSTDLYLVVENDKNQRVVISWGEVFYASAHFQIIISKEVEAINPSKVKTRWSLPTDSRLICANDINNDRFIPNPTRIIVRSYSGSFATEKPNDVYTPEIKVLMGTQSHIVSEIAASIEQRKYSLVGYGHGMGYKGVQSVNGFVLKDVLNGIIQPNPDDLRTSIAVISAKDGYRAVFSLSEIINRNDNQDMLIIDKKESRSDGRYALFASADFFVDRNVKAIEKIEIVKVE